MTRGKVEVPGIQTYGNYKQFAGQVSNQMSLEMAQALVAGVWDISTGVEHGGAAAIAVYQVHPYNENL